MKTTPLHFAGLLLVLLVSVSGFAQRDTVFYPDSRNVQLISVTKGNKKVTKEFDQAGHQLAENNYENNKQHGTQRRWNSNGKLVLEAHYKNGLKDGKYSTWFADGKKKEEFNFAVIQVETRWASVEHGKQSTWNANGKPAKVINYRNGEKWGAEENWFDNGNKRNALTYEAGKRMGPYTYWHDNGKMAETGAFDTLHKKYGERKTIEEVKTGLCKTWNKAGILTAEGSYIKGKHEGKHITRYDDGNMKSEVMYRKGQVYGPQKSWFSNGQLQYLREQYMDYDSIRKAPYYRNEGVYEEYREDGSTVKKGSYIKGKQHGPWVYYSKNTLYETAEYHHGMLLNTHKIYHPNGKLLREEHYDLYRISNRDTTMLNGPYIDYYDNGAVSMRKNYVDGKLANDNAKTYSRSGFVTMEYIDEGATVRKIDYSENGVIKLESVAVKEPNVSMERLKFLGEKFYDEKGKLRKKINYVNGKAQGFMTEWTESGLLLSETYLFNPTNDSPWPGNTPNSWNALYYSNGQPWKEQYIRNSWGTGYEIEWYITGQLKRVQQQGIYDVQWLQNGELLSVVFFENNNNNLKKDTVVPPGFAANLYQQFNHPKTKMLRFENAESGWMRSYYNDKQVRFETFIANGKPDSVFRGYFPDGSLFVEWHLQNGKPHGKYVLMNNNKTLYESGTYCNGSVCGDWVINQVNGKPYQEYGIDESGKRTYQKEYYTENGQPRSLQLYRNGKLYGVQKSWAPNGVLIGQYEMHGDTAVGEHINWNDKGEMQRRVTYNSRGIKEGPEESWWYKTGKKASEVFYVNNKKEGPAKTFWPNGRLRGEGNYVNDVAEGYWMVYDSTGAPGRKVIYVKGEEQVAPSTNPCECVEKKRDIRFCPLITDLVDSTHFPKWQFGYHEKIPNRALAHVFYMDFQNSYSRTTKFNSMTLIAYQPLEVRFPDKKGIMLVLTPCKSKGAQLPVTANTENGNPDATHLEFSPYRLAFRFDDRLLKPVDPNIKNSEASFNVKFMEYEQKGITLHQPVADCFNASYIGKTKMELTLNNFVPVLTAKENTTGRLLDSTWKTYNAFYTEHLQVHFKTMFNGIVNGNGLLKVPFTGNNTLQLPARGVTSNDQFIALELLITDVKMKDNTAQFKNNGKTISTSVDELKKHFAAAGFSVNTTTSPDNKTIRIQLFYRK